MRDKFVDVLEGLDAQLVDRREEIEHILASIIAEEHVFLLGPPGVAKSLLTRKLFNCFEGSYFEKTVSKTTQPDEVAGPFDIKKFEEGLRRNKTSGYLPEATWAFLDEIWKSNSAVLNILLPILEEGIFQNGDEVMDVPLESMISASNELPQEDILSALYDRFLVRLHVTPVSSETDFIEMVKTDDVSTKDLPTIGDSALKFARQSRKNMEVTDTFYQDLYEFKQVLEDKSNGDLIPTDRRWKKSVKFLKSYCWLVYGPDTVVSKDHFRHLENVLWDKPDQKFFVSSAAMDVMGATMRTGQQKVNKIQGHLDTVKEVLDDDDAHKNDKISRIQSLYSDAQDEYAELEEYVEEHDGHQKSDELESMKKAAQGAMSTIREKYRYVRMS